MKTPVYDRLGEMTVLTAFLEAKLWMAIEEWDKLSHMNTFDDNNIIMERLKYARNQVSVIKQLLRDSSNPERTLKRWLDYMESQKGTVESAATAPSAVTSSQQS